MHHRRTPSMVRAPTVPATVLPMPPLLPACLAFATGWAAPPDPAALAHANAAMPCQWPTVVSFRTSEAKCTATLVHPQVIVTAAHCLELATPGRIRFGEQYQPAAFMIDVERCGLDPDYPQTHAPSSDVGFCVLAEPVEGIPLTPLLTACETPWLHEGLRAVIVGLGQTERSEEFGIKRYAFTALDSDLRADGTVWVGDDEVNGCLGDSGGPALVQSPAGTWHTLGVLTFGPECGQGPGLYRALFDRMAWLEAETGFDLSPCHDAAGRHDPGPACHPIALDPLAQDLGWAELCASDLAEPPTCPASAAETDGPLDPSDTTTPATDTDGASSTATTASSTSTPTGCACGAVPGPRTRHLPWLAFALAIRRRRARARRVPSRPRARWSPRHPRCPG
jgi:hypothetical protein